MGAQYDSLSTARGEVLTDVDVAGPGEVKSAVEAAYRGLAIWSRMTGGRAWSQSGAGGSRCCARATARSQTWKRAIPASRSRRRRLSTSTRDQTVSNTTPAWHPRSPADHINLGNAFVYTPREPIGVVAGIGAWSYPHPDGVLESGAYIRLRQRHEACPGSTTTTLRQHHVALWQKAIGYWPRERQSGDHHYT